MPALALNTTSNTAVDALQVICAWPVSGQYGPGSRILYYVLVAACVFARKAEWLRNACLAAALLFPAVAAIHGIVLASLHENAAVDMDVFGAFQLCSIGILAAPVTVKISKTYFMAEGRNIIFVWTGLILAGLLSLTVEFFRIQTHDCIDDLGNPLPADTGSFIYGSTMCGLTCLPEDPTSPLRGGSANNIYVILAPSRLTFNTATLLAAACCIPAVLSLISMWNKVLESNWMSRFGVGNADDADDEATVGINGATKETMNGVNNFIAKLMTAVEVPIFGAAVMAILIIGERNFFSHQVSYQTEPIASVGQWAPIAGTVLAVLGSLYLLLVAQVEAVIEEGYSSSSSDSMRQVAQNLAPLANSPIRQSPPPKLPVRPAATQVQDSINNEDRATSSEIAQTTTQLSRGQSHSTWSSNKADAGKRRKVARTLTTFSNYLGSAAHDQFNDLEFKRGKAVDFPEIPGEEHRNPELSQIREQYNQHREDDDGLQRHISRAPSFTGSFAKSADMPRPSSPSPSTTPRRPHADTLNGARASGSFELNDPRSTFSVDSKAPQRRATLEVPSEGHHRTISTPSVITTNHVTIPSGPGSPTIVVSDDDSALSQQKMLAPMSPILDSPVIDQGG